MRTIQITRKGQFQGAAVQYFCVLNLERSINELRRLRAMRDRFVSGDIKEFANASTQIVPLSAGQSVSLEVNEEEHTLFVVAFPFSQRAMYSQEIRIPKGEADLHYLVKQKIGLLTNSLTLQEM